MRQREPAICLRCTDYSETSQVLHLLTRGAGLVRLLAKGSKRPKSKSGGAIDLMSEGDLVFIGGSAGGLGTLTEFSESVSRAGLRRDAGRLNAALFMVELAGEALGEGDSHPEVFDLLHNGLERLNQQGAVAAVLAYFQWRLLRLVGLLGEMGVCVSCGQTAGAAGGGHAAYFSSIQGGLLCPACEGSAAEKYRLDGATMAGLATLAAAEAGRKVTLPDKQAAGVNHLLAYHASHQLGKPLKMARHAIGP
jgi:DNA repair protein RecO (recombination protein O)